MKNAKNIYAAVDLGASSGRVIAAYLENGIIESKEIHRFENMLVKKNSHICWDIDYLFTEIKKGLCLCKESGYTPDFIAIDTWGVDFVLVGEDGERVCDTVSYRDPRTFAVTDDFDDDRLYSIAGIQKVNFNTVYQLAALKKEDEDALERAKYFMQIPDYLGYLLTGIPSNEYTNASTTGMLNAAKRDWSDEIIEMIGIKKDIFLPLSKPATLLGELKSEIADELGFSAKVVHCASHDTAAAVMAFTGCPETDIYISSGTWSLLGVEADEPNITEKGRAYNFTNEGGYGGKIRYLKNIMGLWMIQSVRRLLGNPSFTELSDMARECGDTGYTVDVNDSDFLAPDDMIEAVKSKVGKELSIPEVLSVIYHSLARYYARTFEELEDVLGKHFERVVIIGGGSRDTLLNSLTEQYSGKKVIRGAVEATALGNILAQMIYSGEIPTLEKGREIVSRSI